VKLNKADDDDEQFLDISWIGSLPENLQILNYSRLGQCLRHCPLLTLILAVSVAVTF